MSALGKEIAEAVMDAWIAGSYSSHKDDAIAAADAAIAPLVEAARALADVADSKLSTVRETVGAVDSLRAILASAGDA